MLGHVLWCITLTGVLETLTASINNSEYRQYSHRCKNYISYVEFMLRSYVVTIFKAKAVPLHATKTLGGEKIYSSYSFSTSALDGGEWSSSRPCRALAPGKGTPIPTVQKAGWIAEPV
jgi:hypothetical protein